MSKFKVGDRVRFVRDFGFLTVNGNTVAVTKGATGKVVEVRNTLYGDKYYSIKIDKVKDCYAGRVPVSDIELISRDIAIKHIINDRATIVILPDGRKGVAKCHPDDKFDEYEGLRIATAKAYGREPFPKEEVKEEPEYEFNIGDVVVVVDEGENYGLFIEKFEEIAPHGKWKGGYGNVKNGFIYRIIGRGLYKGKYEDDIVYAIQDFDGNGYLIGEDGIKKVTV